MLEYYTVNAPLEASIEAPVTNETLYTVKFYMYKIPFVLHMQCYWIHRYV